LEEIITSHNKLTKLEIKDCEQLKELYTHKNQLIDLNVSELKKLKVLSYSENKLSDSKKVELDALGLKEKSTRPAHPIRTLANDEFINNTEITDIDISNESG
jgi:Leucine-rich repeat (LRR) protein